MSRLFLRLFVLGIFTTFFTLSAFQQSYRIKVDWSTFNININASIPIEEETPINQRHLMRTHAKEEILREASQFLENFQIDSESKISEALASNKVFAREYSLFLETLELGSLFFRSRKIETSLTIPLRGRSGLLRHTPIPWNTLEYQLLSKEEYVGEAYNPKIVKGEFKRSLAPVIYTGLIIDATDIKIKEALTPRIYSQNGRLIFGPEFIRRDIGTSRGIAAYVTSLAHSEVLRRAGKHPLLTVALSPQGRHQTNLVMATEEAAKLFDHPQTVTNLLKCRVIILKRP